MAIIKKEFLCSQWFCWIYFLRSETNECFIFLFLLIFSTEKIEMECNFTCNSKRRFCQPTGQTSASLLRVAIPLAVHCSRSSFVRLWCSFLQFTDSHFKKISILGSIEAHHHLNNLVSWLKINENNRKRLLRRQSVSSARSQAQNVLFFSNANIFWQFVRHVCVCVIACARMVPELRSVIDEN